MKGNCSLSSTFRRFVSSCQMQLLRIIISSILATNVLISAPGSQQSPGNLSIVAKELLFRYLILIRGYYSFPVPFCCWWWTYPLLCFWNYYCYFEMHKTSSSTLLSGLQPASQPRPTTEPEKESISILRMAGLGLRAAAVAVVGCPANDQIVSLPGNAPYNLRDY